MPPGVQDPDDCQAIARVPDGRALGFHCRDGSGDFEWEVETKGIRFTIPALMDGIGSESTSLEVTVRNSTPTRVVVDHATLEIAGKIYDAQTAGRGEEHWRSVASGTTGRITLFWSCGAPLYEVLGQTAIMRVAFHRGTEADAVRIEFRR